MIFTPFHISNPVYFFKKIEIKIIKILKYKLK